MLVTLVRSLPDQKFWFTAVGSIHVYFFYKLISKFLKINIFVLEAHKTHICNNAMARVKSSYKIIWIFHTTSRDG